MLSSAKLPVSTTHNAATPRPLKPPVMTLLIAAIVVGLQYAGLDHDLLYFDRAAIWQGESWRLLTGHLVHADNEHLRWNLLALLMLGFLLEQQRTALLPVAVLAGVVVIDAWLLSPFAGIDRYCGLSGLLNTVLVLTLWQEWRRDQRPLLLVIGLLAFLKIGVELFVGQSILTAISWPPYPPAHAWGYLAGVLLVVKERAVSVLIRTKHHDKEAAH